MTPQIRKGLTGTGALAASLGVSIPVNYRGETGCAMGRLFALGILGTVRAEISARC